jgi:hypothetical protein
MPILLSTITGIGEEILTGARPLEIASVAKRMFWASRRTTTRREDLAYCLMGIFLVNMPMLHGEGARAFIRLQEEIMEVSDDETLFAWTNPEASTRITCYISGIFADSGSYVPYFDPRASAPYAMANQGLRINLSITHIEYSETLHVAAQINRGHLPKPPPTRLLSTTGALLLSCLLSATATATSCEFWLLPAAPLCTSRISFLSSAALVNPLLILLHLINTS